MWITHCLRPRFIVVKFHKYKPIFFFFFFPYYYLVERKFEKHLRRIQVASYFVQYNSKWYECTTLNTPKPSENNPNPKKLEEEGDK